MDWDWYGCDDPVAIQNKNATELKMKIIEKSLIMFCQGIFKMSLLLLL